MAGSYECQTVHALDVLPVRRKVSAVLFESGRHYGFGINLTHGLGKREFHNPDEVLEMASPNDQLNPDKLNQIIQRDFDFIFELRHLGESSPSNPRLWGEFIRDKYDHQTIRRMYVRLLMSQVEGTIATMKAETLERTSRLSIGEQAALAEASYDIDDSGNVRQRPNFPKFLNNVRFAFRTYAKIQDISFVPDYGGKGWQSFREVVDIRNRLTHPKQPEEMVITDAEMVTVDEAHDWFVESYRGLLTQVIDKLKARPQKS